MRKLVWSDRAVLDFDDQLAFIAADSSRNAAMVAGRLDESIRKLQIRSIGRPGRVAGTYEKSVDKTSLIIVYALPNGGETLLIQRIIHAARDWNPGALPD